MQDEAKPNNEEVKSSEPEMFSNTKDSFFAQQIIKMRQREQDGEPEPSPADLEEESKKPAEEDNRNFLTRLYEDETFLQ